MMRFLLFSIFTFINIQLLYGQDKSYKNYKHEWPECKPERIQVNQQYVNEPAVILEEKTEMELVEDKFFYHFHINYFIKKSMRILYQKKEGIDNFTKFSLPETFDPTGSYFGLSLEQQNKIHRPKGDFDVIVYFVARIIKQDGSIVKADITDSAEIEDLCISFYFKMRS